MRYHTRVTACASPTSGTMPATRLLPIAQSSAASARSCAVGSCSARDGSLWSLAFLREPRDLEEPGAPAKRFFKDPWADLSEPRFLEESWDPRPAPRGSPNTPTRYSFSSRSCAAVSSSPSPSPRPSPPSLAVAADSSTARGLLVPTNGQAAPVLSIMGSGTPEVARGIPEVARTMSCRANEGPGLLGKSSDAPRLSADMDSHSRATPPSNVSRTFIAPLRLLALVSCSRRSAVRRVLDCIRW
mmetsp:Transcript_53273/g.169212  ORF Transcript_53273/g.169212 Transcript_53273/m.169212 type:complete len:243 (+) Transcript_53273:1060-1788(+)